MAGLIGHKIQQDVSVTNQYSKPRSFPLISQLYHEKVFEKFETKKKGEFDKTLRFLT